MDEDKADIEMVTPPKRELDELRDSERFLECLTSAGVDNWIGYDEAQAMYSNG